MSSRLNQKGESRCLENRAQLVDSWLQVLQFLVADGHVARQTAGSLEEIRQRSSSYLVLGLLVMAGLWKWQRSVEGSVSQVFVILTTRANALMTPIHDRMPVVLDESRLDEWMDPNNPDMTSLRAMLGAAGRLADRCTYLAVGEQRQKRGSRTARLVARLKSRLDPRHAKGDG